jgi:Domain of unknown function (DUF2357)
MDIPISGADTWLTLNDKPLSFLNDNENLHAQTYETRDNMLRVTPTAPEDLQIYVDGKLLETERYGRWLWRPDGYAGLSLLQVIVSGYPKQIAKVRVLPEKLSYDRYKAMLEDISKIVLDLLFRLNSPAGEKTVVHYREHKVSALRIFELIQKIMEELDGVFNSICRSPHCMLQNDAEQKYLFEVRHFSSETVPVTGAILKLPGQVATRSRTNCLPLSWIVQQNTLTYDVHENRLLKQFVLRQLVVKLNIIQEMAQHEIKRREKERTTKLFRGWKDDETSLIEELEQIQADCQQMTKRCVSWGSEPFLKTVKSLSISGKATQVLLKHPS